MTQHPVGTIQVGEGLGDITECLGARHARRYAEQAKTAAQCLAFGFVWCESPEGTTFWGDIHDRLLEISRGLTDHAEALEDAEPEDTD